VDRNRGIRKVLIFTLTANSIVSAAKIAYGMFTHSVAMESDGFHSLFDGISNLLGLLGIWIASHPPDRDHPYGHRKYETLFTMAIASMLFLTCYQILTKAYESFFHDHKTVVNTLSFGVMSLTLAVNIVVMYYETIKGRELKSDFLLADAKHTKSDVITSVSVIFGLVFTKLGYPRADAVIGVIIAVLIARLGYGILKGASAILVDTVCIDTYSVEELVKGIEGVRGCHDIRTRGAEHSIFLDLHVLVDREISVEKAHGIADSVESAIKDGFPSVVDIVVHVEPDEVNTPEKMVL
jgi:cation diffusion facilitator family transporter